MLIRVFITTISAFCLFYPVSAEAKRPPKCGDLSRNDIRDTYEAAKDVRYYYSVDDKIEDICLQMEDFKEWHKELPSDFRRNKSFDKTHDKLVDRVEKHIKDLRRPLRILYALINVTNENTAKKLIKEVRIRERREEINRSLDTLNEDIGNIIKFMDDQNMKLEEFKENPPAKWWEPKE